MVQHVIGSIGSRKNLNSEPGISLSWPGCCFSGDSSVLLSEMSNERRRVQH